MHISQCNSAQFCFSKVSNRKLWIHEHTFWCIFRWTLNILIRCTKTLLIHRSNTWDVINTQLHAPTNTLSLFVEFSIYPAYNNSRGKKENILRINIWHKLHIKIWTWPTYQIRLNHKFLSEATTFVTWLLHLFFSPCILGRLVEYKQAACRVTCVINIFKTAEE